MRRAIVLLAIVALLGVFAARIGGSELARAFADTRVAPVVLAAVLQAGMLLSKAIAWRTLLAPRYRIGVRRLLRYTVAAYAASAIAPLRAGEALRVWVLERRDGVPIADGAATAVSEKLLDAAAMFALMLPLPLVVPGLPRRLGATVAIGALVAIALAICLPIAARRSRGFVAALRVLANRRRALAALCALLFGWFVDLAMVELVLFGVGAPLPVPAALVVLLAVNLAIAVPATPAQLGVHEAGALAGLALFHVPADRALAFAVLYHAIQVVPIVAAGLLLEWRLMLGSPPAPATPAAR